MLSRGHRDALALDLGEADSRAVYSITETLLRGSTEAKVETIRGVFSGEGEHLDVTCEFTHNVS